MTPRRTLAANGWPSGVVALRSENTMVTVLRVSATRVAPAARVPHIAQNRNAPGFSSPQPGHAHTALAASARVSVSAAAGPEVSGATAIRR